jgi:hypothetical protein
MKFDKIILLFCEILQTCCKNVVQFLHVHKHSLIHIHIYTYACTYTPIHNTNTVARQANRRISVSHKSPQGI